ncbi:MAG: TonB-dependent receptor [Leptolyngbya sp. SIO3F4]|nr:TonB-dependent receptor [Leptolyngbya sp. SIO3F4]
MKYYVAALLAMGATPCLQAQVSGGDTDTLKTEDVFIVREFEPRIAAARKIGSQPEKDSLRAPKVNVQYEDEATVSFRSDFQPNSIRPAKIKGEPLTKLYRSYLKGGIGNYLTTFGELRLNNLRSRNTLWGVGLKHRAANADMNDIPFSRFSKNRAEVYGTRFLRAHQVNGEISYDRQRQSYYGFSDSTRIRFAQDGQEIEDLEREDFRQTFHEFRAKTSFSSFFADSNALNYEIGLQFTHLSAESDLSENHLVIKSHVERYFGEELASVDLNLDYNSPDASRAYDTQFDPENVADLFVEITPRIELSREKWRLSAGLRSFVESRDASTSFRFYPDAFFKYNVYEEYIIPYAGIKGGLQRNNLNSLRKENPFITNSIRLRNTNERYNFFGGVRGAFSSQISFNVQASVRQEADRPLFYHIGENQFGLDPSNFNPGFNQFDVIYDTLRITQVTAELTFFEEKRFQANLRGDYFSYNPENQAEAWHLPDFTITASGRYDLRDKIVLTSDVFYVSQRLGPSVNPEAGEEVAAGVYAQELDGYLDLNIGAEYRYNKKISAFLQLNNLLAMEYETWQNYRAQRFNLLFGFTYSFWGRN